MKHLLVTAQRALLANAFPEAFADDVQAHRDAAAALVLEKEGATGEELERLHHEHASVDALARGLVLHQGEEKKPEEIFALFGRDHAPYVVSYQRYLDARAADEAKRATARRIAVPFRSEVLEPGQAGVARANWNPSVLGDFVAWGTHEGFACRGSIVHEGNAFTTEVRNEGEEPAAFEGVAYFLDKHALLAAG